MLISSLENTSIITKLRYCHSHNVAVQLLAVDYICSFVVATVVAAAAVVGVGVVAMWAAYGL